MKYLKLAIPVASLAAFAMLPVTSANAQTYKSDFSTEVTLAGGGTNTGKTVTLNAAVPTASSFTLTFPGTEPGGVVGYVLTMNTTTGGLSWTNPASGLTVNLSGDVGGTSAASVIENTAGTDIVGALNNYGGGAGQVAVGSLDANVLDINSTLTVSSNQLGINLANPNAWTAAQSISTPASGAGSGVPLTLSNAATPGAGVNDITGDSWYVTNQGQASFSGGLLTPSGGGLNNSGSNPTTNIDNGATGGTNNIGNSTSTTNVYGNTNINSPASAPAANTDIDATSGTGGVVTIGNNGSVGSPGDSSTTYLAGAVDFTGTVQLPSGSVTASSIGLTNQYMLVGNNATPNVASPLAPSANSVLITDATAPIGTPHWAQTLPSGLTYPAAQITGAGNIGGSTVINTSGTIKGDGVTSDVSTNTGAAGAALTLANTGGAGGYDVTGTSNSWYVTDAGAATFNGGVNSSDGNASNISNTIGSTGSGSTTTIDGPTTNINTPTSAGIVTATTNIDAGPGQEGVINIGNNGGATPADSSTTNIAGALNISGTTTFTGPVNIPAGDLSLGLAYENIFVGNNATPNVAAPLAPSSNSVFITAGTDHTTPEWATTLPSGLTIPTLTASSSTNGVSGAALSLNNTDVSGTSLDVSGTGNTWNVTNTGAATFTSVNAGSGAITNTGNAQIGTGASTTNDFGTGNGDGNTIGVGGGTPSTTTINGTLNITGAVTYTTAPTIPLATSDIFIGNATSGGQAEAVAMAGDATIAFTAGTPDVATITIGAGKVTNTDLAHSSLSVNSGSGLSGGGSVTLGSSTTLTINDAYANVWSTSQTFNGGVASSGSNDLALTSPSSQAIDLNNTNANAVNIGAGTSEANTIDIGNGTAPLGSPGTYSTTTLAGAVNFTGTVTLPAGSVTASSIALTSGHMFVGDHNGDAKDEAMNGDATMAYLATDNNKVTVSAASGASGFTVTNATQLNGTLTAVGQTTLGSTALSSATVAATATLALTANNSAYLLTATAAPVTVTSIAGANTTAGQIITLVNSDPTNNITLHSNGSLFLNGGDAIMTPGGSVTLLYDGSKWRLISAE